MAFIFSVLKAVINCSIRSSAFASSQDSSLPKTEKLKLKLNFTLCLKLSFKLYLKLFFKLKLKLRIQEMDPQFLYSMNAEMLKLLIAQKLTELQALKQALEGCNDSNASSTQDRRFCLNHQFDYNRCSSRHMYRNRIYRAEIEIELNQFRRLQLQRLGSKMGGFLQT